MKEQFEGSCSEVSYGPLRMNPFLFQDDVARFCTSRDAAQEGNDKVETCLESKLLDANTDKSVFIIIGTNTITKKLKKDITKNPLTLNGVTLKEKPFDKYLGDMIHKDGLTQSVHLSLIHI